MPSVLKPGKHYYRVYSLNGFQYWRVSNPVAGMSTRWQVGRREFDGRMKRIETLTFRTQDECIEWINKQS